MKNKESSGDILNENFEIKIKKEEHNKYIKNYIDAYKILRATWSIEFTDYSLVKFKKEFYIKVDKKICPNEYKYLLIPETYNKKKIHTHDLIIEVNGKHLSPVSSDDKNLKEINDVFRILTAKSSMEIIKKILKHIENTKSNFYGSLIKRKIEIYKSNLNLYFAQLVNYFILFYSKILENKNIKKFQESNYSEETLNKYERNLYFSMLDLRKKIRKKSNELREYIANLFEYTLYLIESKDEQLIGINFLDIKPANQVYHTLLIKTEEPYTGCADERKIALFRSLFFGETAEFIIRIHNYPKDNASIYYEITPPENTRISDVKRGLKAKNCNLMMENIYRKKQNDKVKFFDHFNEKLIIHLPRRRDIDTKNPNIKVDQQNNLKGIDILPRLFIKFKPIKMLQNWVLISLFIGFFYNSILTLTILNYHFEVFEILKNLNFLKPLYKSGYYQGFWIYGLIIGNRLWLERPSFLWRNSSITSIIIVIWGFALLFLCSLIS